MPSFSAILAVAALLARSVIAYNIVAHRGLFHDITDASNVAENTVDALHRAIEFQLPAVEFDVRPSKDGILFVTHDKVANRGTINDDAGGAMNPIDVALGLQPAPARMLIVEHFSSFWKHVALKVYGRQGRIIRTPSAQKMETLEAILGHLRNLNKPNFLLFLDVQDPVSLKGAATLVKSMGMVDQVYLKFFAKQAIDSARYPLNDTDHKEICLQYAQDHNINGLNIVPQINDGMLAFVGKQAYIDVFQRRLTVKEYLSCWIDAQHAFGDLEAAMVPVISASVPFRNEAAHDAARDALLLASNHGRKRMTIIPNPDAGRNVDAVCRLYKWESKEVVPTIFNTDGRADKEMFARVFMRSEDYVVADLMGDVKTGAFRSDLQSFKDNLC